MTNAITKSAQQSDFSDLSLTDFRTRTHSESNEITPPTSTTSLGHRHTSNAKKESVAVAIVDGHHKTVENVQRVDEEDEIDERDIELTESLHEHFPVEEREEYVVNYFFEGEKLMAEPQGGKHLEGMMLSEWEAQNKLIKFDLPRRYHIQRLIGNGNYAYVCSAMQFPSENSGPERPHDQSADAAEEESDLSGGIPVAVKKNAKVFPRKRTMHPESVMTADCVQLLDELDGVTFAEEDDDNKKEKNSSKLPHEKEGSHLDRRSVMVEETLTDKEFLIQKRIVRELKILKHLNHENIISLKDLILPQSYEEFEDVYIVTDLMDTDLRSVIQKDYNTCKKMIAMTKNSEVPSNAAALKALAASLLLSDTHIQYIIYQILRGLKYIHSADILHRDLKPNNILLNTECQVKICDFGLARGIDFESGNPRMSTSYVQTRWYRAPELLLNTDQVTKAIDVWSVGCILAELLGRKPLFRGTDYLDQIDKILDIVGSPDEEDIVGSEDAIEYVKRLRYRPVAPFRTIYPNANPLAIDLLEKLLVFNPAKRISAAGALAHAYFHDFHNESNEPNCAPFDDSFEEEFVTKKSLKREHNNTRVLKSVHDPNSCHVFLLVW